MQNLDYAFFILAVCIAGNSAFWKSSTSTILITAFHKEVAFLYIHCNIV